MKRHDGKGSLIKEKNALLATWHSDVKIPQNKWDWEFPALHASKAGGPGAWVIPVCLHLRVPDAEQEGLRVSVSLNSMSQTTHQRDFTDGCFTICWAGAPQLRVWDTRREAVAARRLAKRRGSSPQSTSPRQGERKIKTLWKTASLPRDSCKTNKQTNKMHNLKLITRHQHTNQIEGHSRKWMACTSQKGLVFERQREAEED